MKKYTKEEIKELSYTDFVSLIKEENRPSGGKNTIREIALNTFLNKDSKVLEIGCTNGFSSIEINKILNCNVIGVDINENSVDNANERIKELGLDSNKIKFEYGNAEKLKYGDEEFDLIICGNAMSFVNDKKEAFKELKRVLKPNGFISMVPIWYKEKPSDELVKNVSNELGFNIHCYYEEDWSNFDNSGMELYLKKDFKYICANEKELNLYVNTMIDSKEHLKVYNTEEIKTIKERWKKTMEVFNENAKYTNFSIILLRKNLIEEEVSLLKVEEL